MTTKKIELLPTSLLGMTYLQTAAESFLTDRKAQKLAKGTLIFYTHGLRSFVTFCEGRAIKTAEGITPQDIKEFLLWLEENGHNPGGIHACYRAVKTFLLWIENELEPENWKNPIRKVKAPKMAKEPIEGIDLTDFAKLLQACQGKGFTAIRDSALIRFLLDTGARASEVLAITLRDVDFTTGQVLIRQGKGRKPRFVFFGKRTRKALREYIRTRKDTSPALWVSEAGEPLLYTGLRLMIQRRSRKAGIEPPSPHDFRRAFALEYLRAGGDIFTLQKIMGHADITVLRRYLAQTDTDTQEGHARFGPVDRL